MSRRVRVLSTALDVLTDERVTAGALNTTFELLTDERADAGALSRMKSAPPIM